MKTFSWICMLALLMAAYSTGISGLSTASPADCEPTSLDRFNLKGHRWQYFNFESMRQLNIKCDISKYSSAVKGVLIEIYLNFERWGILNSSIDLNPFLALTKMNHTLKFQISQIRGFDVEMPGPILLVQRSNIMLDNKINFYSLNFDFYYRGRLVDAQLCNATIFDAINVALFSRGDFLRLSIGEKSELRNPVCPYVFKNALVNALLFQNLENDRMTRHTLSFLPILGRGNRTVDLRAHFETVNLLNLYNVPINASLLNPLVFANIQELLLEGKLVRIQPHLFEGFYLLINLRLKVDDARSFFHASSNEWMRYLFPYGETFKSHQEMVNLSRHLGTTDYFKLDIADESSSYDYPEEDFCLFKYFPSYKFILFKAWKNIRSCANKFLAQNNLLILQKRSVNQSDWIIYDIYNASELDKCNFTYRLSLCSVDSLKQDSYISYADLKYVFKWVDFLGPVVSFSFVACVAFVLNLLTILIIRNKKNQKEKLFEAKMFEYILLGSAFSCLECFIYQFKLINMCMGSGAIYCSSIYSTMFAQYFGIIVEGCLSEVLKTCGMLNGLLFSLQRYVETSKTENKRLNRFSKIHMSRILLFILVMSFTITVPKIFDYQIRDDDFFYADSPLSFVMNIKLDFTVKSVLYLLHYFFNDFVLLAVNFAIDLRLVTVIKRNLRQKLKMKAGEKASTANDAEKAKLDKELKKKRSVESKANALIISSIIIYVFCRFPELAGVLFFYFYIPDTLNASACFSNTLCFLLADTIEYFYMLSYAFNILLYYKLNNNFKKGFRNFFGIKDKKSKVSNKPPK